MTRVANALHGRQMKVGTRRRQALVADLMYIYPSYRGLYGKMFYDPRCKRFAW
jgi:hypothetical protein